MRISVRKLRKDDFDGYCRLQYSLHEDYLDDPVHFAAGTYSKINKRVLKKDFLEMMNQYEHGKYFWLFAFSDGKMVGQCNLFRNRYGTEHMVELGYAVKREYRGKGVGSVLLKELIKAAKSKNFDVAVAETFHSSRASTGLLKKFGFRRWGYGPNFEKIDNGKYVDLEYHYLNLKKI